MLGTTFVSSPPTSARMGSSEVFALAHETSQTIRHRSPAPDRPRAEAPRIPSPVTGAGRKLPCHHSSISLSTCARVCLFLPAYVEDASEHRRPLRSRAAVLRLWGFELDRYASRWARWRRGRIPAMYLLSARDLRDIEVLGIASCNPWVEMSLV